jgi:hypothetical protein
VLRAGGGGATCLGVFWQCWQHVLCYSSSTALSSASTMIVGCAKAPEHVRGVRQLLVCRLAVLAA